MRLDSSHEGRAIEGNEKVKRIKRAALLLCFA